MAGFKNSAANAPRTSNHQNMMPFIASEDDQECSKGILDSAVLKERPFEHSKDIPVSTIPPEGSKILNSKARRAIRRAAQRRALKQAKEIKQTSSAEETKKFCVKSACASSTADLNTTPVFRQNNTDRTSESVINIDPIFTSMAAASTPAPIFPDSARTITINVLQSSQSKLSKRERKNDFTQNRDQGLAPVQFNAVKRKYSEDNYFPGGTKDKRTKIHESTVADETNSSGAVVPQKGHCVCIMAEPFRDLSQEQATCIEQTIGRFIMEDVASSDVEKTASFGGKAHLSNGVVKVRCLDDFSVLWLIKKVQLITPFEDGTKLVVKRQSDIPRRVKAGLLLPKYDKEDIKFIHGALIKQNRWIDIGKWSLYSAEHQEAKGAVFLKIGIPEEDIPRLLENGRALSYKMGSVYVRFSKNIVGEPASTSSNQSNYSNTVAHRGSGKKDVNPYFASDSGMCHNVVSQTKSPLPDHWMKFTHYDEDTDEETYSDSCDGSF